VAGEFGLVDSSFHRIRGLNFGDVVKEALGHEIAAPLICDRIFSISTVATQNASANRFASAAGTSALSCHPR
jgi:hypothetical protein